MGKYLKLILLVIVAGLMMNCEKNSGDPEVGSSNNNLTFINNSDATARLIIESKEVFLPISAAAGSSKSMAMPVLMYHFQELSSVFSVKITVEVWNSEKAAYEKIYESFERIDTYRDMTITVDKYKYVTIDL